MSSILTCWTKVVDPLPKEVGQRQQQKYRHASRAPAREEDAPLRAENEAQQKRYQKEHCGVLVFDTQSGQQSEEQPDARTGCAICQPQDD
jgi:hypothetical protein